MDYDCVFVSMVVLVCCWWRIGEIFCGNKEMVELIKVFVDKLRDVSILYICWIECYDLEFFDG